jgi:futalosine hydrolase
LNILLVAATAGELAPIANRLQPLATPSPQLTTYINGDHQIDILTTGVGMVATAVSCTRALLQREYHLALNAGVCGAFDPGLAPPAVVHVVSERMPELGAEDGDAFLSIHDLQLLAVDEFPFHNGELVNLAPPDNEALRALPAVTAVTVNTVHGSESSIARLLERITPQVETMEGAAFMYACLVHGLPFAEIRAVSNRVERRNRASWKMTEAVAALNMAVAKVLDSL